MKKIIFLLLASIGISYADNNFKVQDERPSDFVNIQEYLPQAQLDMRYYTDHNFVGRKINGYEAPVCLLTKPAAVALKKVEDKLLAWGLTLKFYDCYRPQRAVNDFANWAKQIKDTKMRGEFYPTVDKANLFKDGYIAYQSGHSRGSTFDVTIVPLNSQIPQKRITKLVSCTSPQSKRYPDNSLDFGSGYDCFSPVSHPDYAGINVQARANRLLLASLMDNAGFKGLKEEWWHFTLRDEPYSDTYFNFPVR